MKKLKILELFGGIGAPRAALENLGVDIKSIDYVEVLPYAVDAYNAMYDNSYKIQNVINWNLEIDVLIHGSPCVDFSRAGKNDTSTGRSLLYNRTLSIIEFELLHKPKYIVWENVKGLLFDKHIEHLNHYISELKRLGYKVVYSVFNSRHYGIPQNRERIFVIAIRNDIQNEFDFSNIGTKDMNPLINYLEEDPKQVIGYDIVAPTTKYTVDDDGNIEIETVVKHKLNTRKLEWIDMGKIYNEFTNFYVYPRASDGKLINGIHNRAWKIDKYIGCIPASKIPQIGKMESGHLYCRYLTQRECLRLMGFRDEQINKLFERGIPALKIYQLAGNSIVVDVLEVIFKELLKDYIK